MKRTLLLLAATIVVAVGCSSAAEDDTTSTPEPSNQTVAPSAPPTTTDTAEPDRQFPIIGEEARSDGIVVTVHGVAESPTIRINDSGYTGEFAEYTDRVARAGGKYVVVDTTVFNDTLRPIDITCAAPIQNTLTTEDRRQYSTIDEQYNVEGNPGCNDMLQPGFDAAMKFVYEIPDAGVPIAFGFADRETSYDKPTYVELITAN